MGHDKQGQPSTEWFIGQPADRQNQPANSHIQVENGNTGIVDLGVHEINQRQDSLQRLRSAGNQLNDLIEMITAGAPCDQILNQSRAIQAKLRNTSVRMIFHQAHQSETILLESSCQEEIISEIKRVCELYLLLIQYANHNEENI